MFLKPHDGHFESTQLSLSNEEDVWTLISRSSYGGNFYFAQIICETLDRELTHMAVV